MRRGHLPLIAGLVPSRRAAQGAAFACAVSIFCAAHSGHAETCRRPDLIEAIPEDGAEGVPLNAQPIARYNTFAEYLDEEISLSHVGVETFSLTGLYNSAEGILTLVPPQPLEPGERYQIRWPELRGIGTASKGRGRTVEFTAGSREDTEPPRFGGVLDVKWDVERNRDECTDSVEERFDFELELGNARDDGGRDMLTLVVFQTAGPDIGPNDPPLPVLVRKLPTENTVHVERVVSDAVGRVCFAAIVRDLTGFPSASGSKEACADTVAPPFFYGCRTAPRPPSSRGESLALIAVLVLALRRCYR